MLSKTLATGEVATLLGIRETQIQDSLRRYPVLRPEMRRGRRRWTREDIEALAAHFDVQVKCAEGAE